MDTHDLGIKAIVPNLMPLSYNLLKMNGIKRYLGQSCHKRV
jgi:hypothetical protein